MKFGDVVNYNGREWVYLAATPEIIYLAVIANREISQKFIDQRNKIFTKVSKETMVRQQSTSWCFVELSTAEFKDRIAHYGTPENECSFDDISNIVSVLNFEDQNKLKKEITEDGGVSGKLRELVKDIIIQES